MTQNPLEELKRRLEDDSAPMAKRLCLAKNIVSTNYLPSAASERVVGDWIQGLANGGVSADTLKYILKVCENTDHSTQLKLNVVKLVCKYLSENKPKHKEIENIINFIENKKVISLVTLDNASFLRITHNLLRHMKDPDTKYEDIKIYQRIFRLLIQYYKEVKKKVEFMENLLKDDQLELILSFLGRSELRNDILEVCNTLLFPLAKKNQYSNFLSTIIRKESTDELLKEKGESIQGIVKIMTKFFSSSHRQNSDFIEQFIDVFTSCLKQDSQIVFLFFIVVLNFLNIKQSYLNLAMVVPTLEFIENDHKIKRKVFLKCLESLLANEIDLNVKLTDVLGDKGSRVEIKKNFSTLLQASLMGVVKMEGKCDKTTLRIIQTAVLLDPGLIEPKLDSILPAIMASKKNSSNMATYTETIMTILEIVFKLSRFNTFLTKILPNVKIQLEALNTEQFRLKQEVENAGIDSKVAAKILTADDVFPAACVEKYAALSAELTLKQSSELFVLLMKDFDEHCLMMLAEGFVSPSLLIMAEVLGAILCAVLRHSKMADQAVPRQVAAEFWASFDAFQDDHLKRFGQTILKLKYNRQLYKSFLSLCLTYTSLGVLRFQYGGTESFPAIDGASAMDLSAVLPCLTVDNWELLASRVDENSDTVAKELLMKLLLNKLLLLESIIVKKGIDDNDQLVPTQSYIVEHMTESIKILEDCQYYREILLKNLQNSQAKILTKALVKHVRQDDCQMKLADIIESSDKSTLQHMTLDVVKNILKLLDTDGSVASLSKALTKSSFECKQFFANVNVLDYLKNLTKTKLSDDCMDSIASFVDILHNLNVEQLNENCQLIVVFLLVAVKMSVGKEKSSKKLRWSIDACLLKIFETSPKCPDLYQIFSVDDIFNFDEGTILKTLTLTKMSNKDHVIKAILDFSVRKVRTDSEIVKRIVKILLNSQKFKKNEMSIEYFTNDAFQMTCMILPIIAREKKSITTSAFRSILADLQEKLHKSLLKAFKSINFAEQNSSNADGTQDGGFNALATLNAIEAYALTLSRYCESNDAEDLQHLDCLWSGLDYFVKSAMAALSNEDSKTHHIESSVQLFNAIFRHAKKLATHPIFAEKEQIHKRIWQCVKSRLTLTFTNKLQNKKRATDRCLDDVTICVKFLSELCSVDFFNANIVTDLTSLAVLKTPNWMAKDKNKNILISHEVSKFLWNTILKSNIVGPKCTALAKVMLRTCKNLTFWLKKHFDSCQTDDVTQHGGAKMEDCVCDVVRREFDVLSEVILAAKKIPLNSVFLDAIFSLSHQTLLSMSRAIDPQTGWDGYFGLWKSLAAILNSLVLSRDELLEDRWPCYLQCYRGLLRSLCDKASSLEPRDKAVDYGLSELAHLLEKLTQAICKKKSQVSRLATYLVADVCASIEAKCPISQVRQHLENCAALLLQTTDNTYALSFLRRVLAGNPGHVTLTNMYSNYKRYHKYVGMS